MLNVIVNYANANATTNHADRSAAGLYAGRLAETQDLLARITVALKAHSARQQQEADDYGYAGTGWIASSRVSGRGSASFIEWASILPPPGCASPQARNPAIEYRISFPPIRR